MTAYRRYRVSEYDMCNEGIGEWAGKLKSKFGKWFSDVKLDAEELLDATNDVNIATVNGIKKLNKFNSVLDCSKLRNPWNAARKLYYILDALEKIDSKIATVGNTKYVDKGIELLRDDVAAAKKNKNIDPKEDRFEFEVGSGQVTLKFHDGNTDKAVEERAYKSKTDPGEARHRDDETITLMTIKFKESDNNSLENRRLEWRVARLEHLIEERFGRN